MQAPLDQLDDPWRRGIDRPNAKSLSLSLAPLVAQRSLLFRIKADLAGAGRQLESYTELEDDTESPVNPRLYSLTPQTSAKLFSSDSLVSSITIPKLTGHPHSSKDVLSDEPCSPHSESSASVYSQTSCAHASPAIPSAKPRDLKRQGMAFSPSLRWDGIPSTPFKLPADLPLTWAPQADKPVITSVARRPGTPRGLPAPSPIPPLPLSAKLKVQTLTKNNSATVSVRIMDSPVSPLIAIRRIVEDDRSRRPRRQPAIKQPHVSDHLLVDRPEPPAGIDPGQAAEVVATRQPNNPAKSDIRNEPDKPSKHGKRLTKLSRVIGHLSTNSTSKDKHLLRAEIGKKKAARPSIQMPTDLKLDVQVEVSPMRLSFSDPQASNPPTPPRPAGRTLTTAQSTAPPPPAVTSSSNTALPFPPPLQPLCPPSTPRHLRSHSEMPQGTSVQTPFAFEWDKDSFIAAQGEYAVATRAHRRSRSYSASSRTAGPTENKIPIPDLPTTSSTRPTNSETRPRAASQASSHERLPQAPMAEDASRPPPDLPAVPRPRRLSKSRKGPIHSRGHSRSQSHSVLETLFPRTAAPSLIPSRQPVERRLQALTTNLGSSPPRGRNHSFSSLESWRDRVRPIGEPLIGDDPFAR